MSVVTPAHAKELTDGAKTLGLSLTEQQTQQLMAYLTLLVKWNKAYNLTAVRNPDEMVSRHLLDSLSIITAVQPLGTRWLDVGSGGGMPGIPLAILFPERHISTLDSNGKKTRFQTQVKLELGLDNLHVIHSRVEELQPVEPFDGIVSRAFSSLSDFATWTAHLGDQNTHWLAMKGLYPEEELQVLPDNFRLERSEVLDVPGCQGRRHLLVLRRVCDDQHHESIRRATA